MVLSPRVQTEEESHFALESARNVNFQTSMVESINALRNEVAVLHSDVEKLKASSVQQQSGAPGIPCLLYVRVVERSCSVDAQIGKSWLEHLLGCQVLQYVCVQELPNPAFKVNILESDLRKAMVRVALWTFGGDQV